jgi:hypothetical protein
MSLTLSKHASPDVQAGVSALEARLRRNKTLLGRSLLFDVLADDADRHSATGRGEVGRRPEDSFPIPPHQLVVQNGAREARRLDGAVR